jgi:hypothetical protein
MNTCKNWNDLIERMVSMNIEAFESYLKKDKHMTDHETREIISRISWVETTLNISLQKMFNDGEDLDDIKATIKDVVVAEDKVKLFFEAIWLYQTFSINHCQ